MLQAQREFFAKGKDSGVKVTRSTKPKTPPPTTSTPPAPLEKVGIVEHEVVGPPAGPVRAAKKGFPSESLFSRRSAPRGRGKREKETTSGGKGEGGLDMSVEEMRETLESARMVFGEKAMAILEKRAMGRKEESGAGGETEESGGGVEDMVGIGMSGVSGVREKFLGCDGKVDLSKIESHEELLEVADLALPEHERSKLDWIMGKKKKAPLKPKGRKEGGVSSLPPPPPPLPDSTPPLPPLPSPSPSPTSSSSASLTGGAGVRGGPGPVEDDDGVRYDLDGVEIGMEGAVEVGVGGLGEALWHHGGGYGEKPGKEMEEVMMRSVEEVVGIGGSGGGGVDEVVKRVVEEVGKEKKRKMTKDLSGDESGGVREGPEANDTDEEAAKPGYLITDVVMLLHSTAPPQRGVAARMASGILKRRRQQVRERLIAVMKGEGRSAKHFVKSVPEEMTDGVRRMCGDVRLSNVMTGLEGLEALLCEEEEERKVRWEEEVMAPTWMGGGGNIQYPCPQYLPLAVLDPQLELRDHALFQPKPDADTAEKSAGKGGDGEDGEETSTASAIDASVHARLLARHFPLFPPPPLLPTLLPLLRHPAPPPYPFLDIVTALCRSGEGCVDELVKGGWGKTPMDEIVGHFLSPLSPIATSATRISTLNLLGVMVRSERGIALKVVERGWIGMGMKVVMDGAKSGEELEACLGVLRSAAEWGIDGGWGVELQDLFSSPATTPRIKSLLFSILEAFALSTPPSSSSTPSALPTIVQRFTSSPTSPIHTTPPTSPHQLHLMAAVASHPSTRPGDKLETAQRLQRGVLRWARESGAMKDWLVHKDWSMVCGWMRILGICGELGVDLEVLLGEEVRGCGGVIGEMSVKGVLEWVQSTAFQLADQSLLNSRYLYPTLPSTSISTLRPLFRTIATTFLLLPPTPQQQSHLATLALPGDEKFTSISTPLQAPSLITFPSYPPTPPWLPPRGITRGQGLLGMRGIGPFSPPPLSTPPSLPFPIGTFHINSSSHTTTSTTTSSTSSPSQLSFGPLNDLVHWVGRGTVGGKGLSLEFGVQVLGMGVFQVLATRAVEKAEKMQEGSESNDVGEVIELLAGDSEEVARIGWEEVIRTRVGVGMEDVVLGEKEWERLLRKHTTPPRSICAINAINKDALRPLVEGVGDGVLANPLYQAAIEALSQLKEPKTMVSAIETLWGGVLLADLKHHKPFQPALSTRVGVRNALNFRREESEEGGGE